ncbi:MAG TPA: hypothetical protein VM238_06910 [Phycisphaerae bacterium]|nr:hypothetical protein [Phycisphaerae bacterium]
MCDFGDGIRSGKLPAILYTDETQTSDQMRKLLDSCGATYTVSDTSAGDFDSPVVIVDGCFLGIRELQEVLKAD